HLIALNHAVVLIAVGAAQILCVAAGMTRVPHPMVRMEQSEPQAAINGIGLDQPLQMLAGTQRLLPERMRMSRPQVLLGPVLVAPDSDVDLAAIASRRSPPQQRLLEQRDIDAAPRQMQRRRQTRVAAPDDAGVALHGARELRGPNLFGDR